MSAALNVLSEAMALPRAHRLALASLIIRQANCRGDELRRLVGRTIDPSYRKRP